MFANRVCSVFMAAVLGMLGGCGSAYVARPPVSVQRATPLDRDVSPDRSPVRWEGREPAPRPYASAGAFGASLPWPAVLAVARVDDNAGSLVSIAPRQAELPTDLERIRKQAGVDTIVLLNPLVVGPGPQSRDQIRQAAGDLGAHVLLLYSIRTGKSLEGVTIPGLGTMSLGLIPNETYARTTTASAVFIDVRTGALLGVAESTAEASQLSNAYTATAADEAARARAERRAFSQLTTEMIRVWNGLSGTRSTRE